MSVLDSFQTWLAVKELNVSNSIGETLLSTISVYIFIFIMVTEFKLLNCNPKLSALNPKSYIIPIMVP